MRKMRNKCKSSYLYIMYKRQSISQRRSTTSQQSQTKQIWHAQSTLAKGPISIKVYAYHQEQRHRNQSRCLDQKQTSSWRQLEVLFVSFRRKAKKASKVAGSYHSADGCRDGSHNRFLGCPSRSMSHDESIGDLLQSLDQESEDRKAWSFCADGWA